LILGHHSRFGALTEPAAQPRPAVVSGPRSFSPNVQPSDLLTFQCAGPLRRLQRLPRLGRGPEFLAELVGALDRSFLGVTLNLQLSTFNRVSFLFPSSPHLCALCVLCGENSSSFRSSLIPRHSPLTTNSFIIRTSETPLPQPLYNPHLQTPLGSAGNKGLITPLESALTENPPVTPVESALTKRWGVGSFPSLQHSDIPICFPFIPFVFIPFQTLLHFFAPTKNSTLLFSCNSTLFNQNTRGWVNLMPIHRSHQFGRSLGRNHLSDSVSVNSVFSVASVLIPIPCSTFNFQLSIEDPHLVGTVNLSVPAACRLVSERSTIVSSRTKEGTCHGHRRTENSCH